MNFNKVVFFLISCGSIVMLKASSGVSGRALVRAVRKSDSRAVQRLLADGGSVDVNQQVGSDGSPLIHLAIANGDIEIVRMLLGAGADPNSKDRFGNSALEKAQEGPHWDITTCLLAAGAELGNWASHLDGREQSHMRILVTMSQKSILSRASAIRNWLNWQAKKHKYCDVWREGQRSYTELTTGLQELVGCFEGSPVSTTQVSDVVKKNEGFTDIHAQEGRPYGGLTLSNAAGLGHFDSVQNILANGSDVDEREDGTCCTPLMEALGAYSYCSRHTCPQRLEVVRLLLAHGANVHATTSSGSTVLGEALDEAHYWDAVDTLLFAGAQIDAAIVKDMGEGERKLLWDSAKVCIPARAEIIREWLDEQAESYMPVDLQGLIGEFDGAPVSVQKVEKSLQQIKGYLGIIEQDEGPRKKRHRLN